MKHKTKKTLKGEGLILTLKEEKGMEKTRLLKEGVQG